MISPKRKEEFKFLQLSVVFPSFFICSSPECMAFSWISDVSFLDPNKVPSSSS